MTRNPAILPRSRRHVFGALAVGLTLSLAPIAVGTGTLHADAPQTNVTGLVRGARGEAVRALQQALVNQGIAVAGGVDGVFGAGTEAALKSFQNREGLTASGAVDTASAIALGLQQSVFLGLTQGIRSDAVKQMQQKLIGAGLSFPGGADGIFGAGTAAALKQYQASNGLTASGRVDAATAAALESAAAAATPTPAPGASDGNASTGNQSATTNPLVGLQIGSRGEAVKTLQKALIGAGFTVVGGADGVYGVLTANAVKGFQNAKGLTLSGKVDADTGAALVSLISGSSGQTPAATHDPTVTSPLFGLRYGSLGADVKALQQTLINAGLTVRGGADGVYGTATVAAVKAYQASRGLAVTGDVDAATANALASATSPTTGSTALVGLKAGALGQTVKQLQEALIGAGVTVRGGADGIFGPATSSAVKAFQKSQGLPETGQVDQATAAALAHPKPAPTTGGGSGAAADGYPVFGEKGSRVIALQQSLVNAGVAVRGGVDGDFGGGTSAAVMDFQRREGLSVTGKVDDATGAALGLAKMAEPTAPDPSTVKISVFPVQGPCYYGDSWGYARSGGRVHLGVDIIAASGLAEYAVADGTITKVYTDYPGSLAGNGVRLTMADGTYFFYAHMSSIAEGIGVGTPVKAGQVIGYVGSTGSSGTSHLHFEVHPQGGAAVNPYPIVKAIDGCKNTALLPQP